MNSRVRGYKTVFVYTYTSRVIKNGDGADTVIHYGSDVKREPRIPRESCDESAFAALCMNI